MSASTALVFLKNNPLLKHLIQQLNDYPADCYYIGYSGGRDSHVLLDLLCQARQAGKLQSAIAAIHINHNLNPKADDWQCHCQYICKNYPIDFFAEKIAEKPAASDSIEAFARQKRYQLIGRYLHKNAIFLSAHHQRDQAETFLLQLMRGAGLDGLRAMPRYRRFSGGHYLRPLLDINYQEIVDYAKARRLNFIHDDSNDDTRYDRNYLRHQVLPVLAARFPAVESNIAQSAKWLAEVANPVVPERLLVADLQKCSVIDKKQQIRSFFKAKTEQALSKTQTNYILSHHLQAKADKHPELNVGDYVIRRHLGEICITAAMPENRGKSLPLSLGQTWQNPPVTQLDWQLGHGLFVTDKLMIKALSGNQRFHPHNRAKASTVKKCLYEAKVPIWLRPYYWGLYLEDELVAIPSVGVAKHYYQKSSKAQFPLWIIQPEFVKL